MMFLAVRIEYAFDATIQRSHNPDARKHRWPVMVGNHSPAARPPNRQSPLSQAACRPARLNRDAFKEHLHAIGNWSTIPS
jgi:hypothetical protein